MESEKPPLGVVPKLIWYELRIQGLARAIHQYSCAGMYEPVYWWSLELTEILRMRERHIDNKPRESTTL